MFPNILSVGNGDEASRSATCGVPPGGTVPVGDDCDDCPDDANVDQADGDSDGDGSVAANDFIEFRLSLGGSGTIFDFDNDGAVAASDFIQFRLRFGGSI